MKNHELDLDLEYLAIIKNILQKHLPATAKIGVFGSRVTGKARKYSDVDLLIDLSEKPVPMAILAQLATDFEESDLPFKVDIVDWNTISDEFRKYISSEIINLTF